MLIAVLLTDAAGQCCAPGRLLDRIDLGDQIRAAARQFKPAPVWLTDPITRSLWPEGESFLEIDSRLLHWADCPEPVWLLGSSESLQRLLPLIDRLLFFRWPDQDLPGEQEEQFPCSGLHNLDFMPSGEADPTGMNDSVPVCWQRLPAAEWLDRVMKAGDCDLHLHTTASDGADTPEQMVDRVVAGGLKAFAITDHDNLGALEPASRWLNRCPVPEGAARPRFIPGVELSVMLDKQELHLLGYFPRGGTIALDSFLAGQRELRQQRNLHMISKIQELGFQVTLADFQAEGSGTLGRMQAAILLRDRGYFPSISAAFDELLGYGRPAYVDRPRPSPAEAIWLVRLAGGVAVLAHPELYGWCGKSPIVSDHLLRKLEILQASGLQGVETFHGEASGAAQLEISAAARTLGLIRTGGSDDHGIHKEHAHLYHQGVNWFSRPEILVVAAMISGPVRNGQHTWLLTRRSSPGHGQGFWEFPGGKVEPGETLSQALARELCEELSVEAVIGPRILVLTHDYPERRVILVGMAATLNKDNWQLSVHDDARFVTAQEALALPLLPADVQIFEKVSPSGN